MISGHARAASYRAVTRILSTFGRGDDDVQVVVLNGISLMCMGVSPPRWDRCALCDGTSSLPRARRQGYWRKRSDGGIRFAHFSTSTSAVRRQHPVAGRRDGVPHPRGGNRTTLEMPARRRDGHPQDLDLLFAASAGPKWTIGLCAGSAFIAALSLQPTFARFPATARKQGRPFDRLGQRKLPSPESHPVLPELEVRIQFPPAGSQM